MAAALIASLLVSDKPVPREVTLPDGSAHQLHFRQLRAAEFRSLTHGFNKPGEAGQDQAMAGLVAASLCTEEGEAVLTVEQAAQLTPAAESALLRAIYDVNGLSQREDRALGNG